MTSRLHCTRPPVRCNTNLRMSANAVLLYSGHSNFICATTCYIVCWSRFLWYALKCCLLIMQQLTMSIIALSLFHLRRHYQSFVENLRSADTSPFALSHYFRLMSIATVCIVWTAGCTLSVLIANLKSGKIQPYVNWAFVHYEFSAIWTFPLDSLTKPSWDAVYAFWYMIPISTFIFVSLFAFGEDAVHEYRRSFNWIRNRCVPRWPGDRASAPVATTAQTNELPPLR